MRIITLFLSLTFFLNANAQVTLPEFEKKLSKLLQEYKVPGASVIVIKNDSTIYEKGFGYADIKNKIKATKNTTYRIASLTKPIASVVLFQMMEKNKFSLNDTLKNEVSGYEDFFYRVKKNILKHEPQWSHLIENFNFRRDDITIRHHFSHTAEGIPGSVYKYNGFLFGVLARLVEEKSRQKFSEVLKKNIFEPLAMNTTLPSQNDTSNYEILSRLAKPYKVHKNGTYVLGEYPNRNVNAGAGIVSTVGDLAKFDKAINKNILVNSKSKEQMFTNQILNNGEVSPYGLGWFVQDFKGSKIVWHQGWQPKAFSALYLKILKEGYTFIILANSENLTAPFIDKGYREDVMTSPFAKLCVELLNRN